MYLKIPKFFFFSFLFFLLKCLMKNSRHRYTETMMWSSVLCHILIIYSSMVENSPQQNTVFCFEADQMNQHQLHRSDWFTGAGWTMSRCVFKIELGLHSRILSSCIHYPQFNSPAGRPNSTVLCKHLGPAAGEEGLHVARSAHLYPESEVTVVL